MAEPKKKEKEVIHVGRCRTTGRKSPCSFSPGGKDIPLGTRIVIDHGKPARCLSWPSVAEATLMMSTHKAREREAKRVMWPREKGFGVWREFPLRTLGLHFSPARNAYLPRYVHTYT
jgi:hypothetical protein